MQRKTVITVVQDNDVEVFGDLKTACNHYSWKYWTLSRKKMPFMHGLYLIDRKKIITS